MSSMKRIWLLVLTFNLKKEVVARLPDEEGETMKSKFEFSPHLQLRLIKTLNVENIKFLRWSETVILMMTAGQIRSTEIKQRKRTCSNCEYNRAT